MVNDGEVHMQPSAGLGERCVWGCWGGVGSTRVKWVPFVLLEFFPQFLQSFLLQHWPFSL